jgi:hypothetical protein
LDPGGRAPEDLVPSRPDYISQADGLCAFYESRVEELGKERFKLNAKDLREELDQIRGLTPPRGDEAQVAAINDAAEPAVDGLEANPTVYADDAARTRLFAEVRAAGRRYGLRECGL